MDIVQAIEIFALVTGVAYVVLEILQKNSMWVVGILTGAACAYSFAIRHNWGMMGLNIYYIVMSVIGLIQWRRDGARVGEGKIHIRPLPAKTALWSAVGFVVGSLVLIGVFRALGDGMSVLDATATVLSVIATWWLTRSYIQQWWIWIIADVFAIWMNVNLDKSAFVIQFVLCIISSFIGLYTWGRMGKYTSNPS